ncbi:glycosyltransferase [Oscillibacter sp.]|uniref:glycosyltransferase n=1 Tax=Oscillibacter sp. TaxID=1945593 RepID=UPI002899B235|nr:glycosyltransferase [Oscillibacter sp.]
MPMCSEQIMVSVIMGVRCTQEGTAALKAAVTSILAQTMSEFEFLICENGSAPSAKQLLQALSRQDTRICLIDGTGADSLTQKLNRCLKQARGTWIARMDDDDFSHPYRFAQQLSFLSTHPEICIVGSWVLEQGGTAPMVRKLPPFPRVENFRMTNPFVHPALLLRRQAMIAVGGYSEHPLQEGCDDYDLLLRLYENGCLGANVQQVLLDYSVTASQLKHRPYLLFYHEFRTRLSRFSSLGRMPAWFIWAVKPLVVGLLPRQLLHQLKRHLRLQ